MCASNIIKAKGIRVNQTREKVQVCEGKNESEINPPMIQNINRTQTQSRENKVLQKIPINISFYWLHFRQIARKEIGHIIIIEFSSWTFLILFHF